MSLLQAARPPPPPPPMEPPHKARPALGDQERGAIVAAVAEHTYNELLKERKRRKLAEEELNQAPWESILRNLERPNLPNPIYHTQSTRPNPPDPA